ncbi:MAG TPA: 16S rRNA (cytidine(1402)-2'-O)-methyltransferase, partial [Candidatus Tectomicrobia bacterium]|nr:16S rRNA (cytidine(1402)-2'-O)-methyltransferase [Candidatus Tectomicrobia bacterium]
LARLRALAELDTTAVLYESPHRILATLDAIAEVFGEREIVVGRELTKRFEEVVAAPARRHRERLAAAGVRGEFVVAIPPAPREPVYSRSL